MKKYPWRRQYKKRWMPVWKKRLKQRLPDYHEALISAGFVSIDDDLKREAEFLELWLKK